MIKLNIFNLDEKTKKKLKVPFISVTGNLPLMVPFVSGSSVSGYKILDMASADGALITEALCSRHQ